MFTGAATSGTPVPEPSTVGYSTGLYWCIHFPTVATHFSDGPILTPEVPVKYRTSGVTGGVAVTTQGDGVYVVSVGATARHV